MAPFLAKLFLPIVLCLSISFLCAAVYAVDEISDLDELKVYIVHVRPQSSALTPLSSPEQWADMYASLLESAAGTLGFDSHDLDSSGSRIIHAYRNVMIGFSAMLTTREVQALSNLDWFLRAYPCHVYHPHTTHTPRFMGLRHRTHSVWNVTDMGEGVIIAILDTGVTPGHPSYDDSGMPPPPAKWKGRCDLNASACNNKLIGARSFINYDPVRRRSTESPVDNDGHGTHTSSTAAGSFVKHASTNGNARGIAAGMAPRAHIAVYKVCSDDGCQADDILAGMDAAVGDGADVLSLSLGGSFPQPFYNEPIAIGGFNAIKKGVFVSCSAGNSGPDHGSVTNDAPWLLTVAASTIDRSILSTVKLGDGQEFGGESSFQPHKFKSKQVPLVFPGGTGDHNFALCINGSLKAEAVRGKIVICDRGENSRVEKGQVVKDAGGVGMILANGPVDGYSTLADDHVLPASHIPYAYGRLIKVYLESTSHPTATLIFNGTVTHTPHSPAITSFSSRGPSQVTPGILKPDITGPGVSILAAWNTQKFNMISGTSMSCPHLSGIAALVKKVHPHWSPAAIKSAIMTSAYVIDNTGKPIVDETNHPADLFALGAGHVNPWKAVDPGLIYDLAPEDYYPYLCGLSYSDDELSAVVGRNISCSSLKSIPEGQLNYPSISVDLPANQSTRVTFTRTVTNVGEPVSKYVAEVDVPDGISVQVVPKVLAFKQKNEKKSFVIKFKSSGDLVGPFEGQLRWVIKSKSNHLSRRVRSPISITVR